MLPTLSIHISKSHFCLFVNVKIQSNAKLRALSLKPNDLVENQGYLPFQVNIEISI